MNLGAFSLQKNVQELLWLKSKDDVKVTHVL